MTPGSDPVRSGGPEADADEITCVVEIHAPSTMRSIVTLRGSQGRLVLATLLAAGSSTPVVNSISASPETRGRIWCGGCGLVFTVGFSAGRFER